MDRSLRLSGMWLALAIVVWATAAVAGELGQPAPGLPAGGLGPWTSAPPRDCPFPPSERFTGLAFTGRHAEYTNADTWYPSWAADGNLYSPWTDGNVNGIGGSSDGDGATTGQAVILGDDPLHLVVKDAALFRSSPRPYQGRYPCGSLVHNGVWYYGTYCLNPAGGYKHEGKLYNWPWLGPLVGFRWSKDFGKTWTETPCTPAKPLFGESGLKGEPVKFGAAHFVDFGKNLEHSPDGKAYLVSHGASGHNPKPRYANCSWITGDEIYLARVTPSIETINDPAAYEFFAGQRANGQDAWSKHLADARPIAAWDNNMGCVTMTYVPGLKRFLMCVTDGGTTISQFNTYVLESERATGPWKLVVYMKDFGAQGYFVNFPSKFISADGRTLWLCYAANFTNGWLHTNFPATPPGSRYGICLQEVRLLAAGEGRASADAAAGPANPPAPDRKPPVDPARHAVTVELDSSEAPEMEAWGKTTQHILEQWYATVVEALPSEGFLPPKKIVFTIRGGRGIAETGGSHIVAHAGWFKAHPEDRGAIVHEMVHVVQAYGGRRCPGWLVEGIADYVRFWIYEPGAPRHRVDPQRDHYTNGYQTTGAFLAWLVKTYDKEIVAKLNAACRQGQYKDELFQQYTGKDLAALWKEFAGSLPRSR
jgi:hypothetical protein